MLNASPLPLMSADVPIATAKPEMARQSGCKSESGADTGENFAQTLKAVKQKDTVEKKASSEQTATASWDSAPTETEDGDGAVEENTTAADSPVDAMPVDMTITAETSQSAENGQALVLAEANKHPAASETEEGPSKNRQDAPIAPQHHRVRPMALKHQITGTMTPDQTEAQTPEADGEALVSNENKGGQAKGFALDSGKTGRHLAPEEGHIALKTGAEALSGRGKAPQEKMSDQMTQAQPEGAAKNPPNADKLMQSLLPESAKASTKGLDGKDDTLKQQSLRNVPSSFQPGTTGDTKAEGGNPANRSFQAAEASSERVNLVTEAGRETLLKPTADDAGSTPQGRAGNQDATLSMPSGPAVGKMAAAPASGSAVASASAGTELFQQQNFHQLVEKALFTVKEGQAEARIALKPDQLGHVQMRIVTINNIVTIKIVTESPVARELIDANAGQLKSELQQQGLSIETIEVSVSDDPRDGYRGTRQRDEIFRSMTSKNQQRQEEEDQPPEYPETPQRKRGGRPAGIDYFA